MVMNVSASQMPLVGVKALAQPELVSQCRTADEGCSPETLSLQYLSKSCDRSGQFISIVCSDPVIHGISRCKDRGMRRQSQWRLRHAVTDSGALLREEVQIRRLNRPVAVATEIIGS